MATCFCGCDRKVTLTRRAFNGTGRLIRERLLVWDEIEEPMREAGTWSRPLDGFVGTGREMDEDLRKIVHGAPARLLYSQRQMTQWLKDSNRLLKEIQASGTARASGLFPDEGPEAAPEEEADSEPQRLDPDARAARRAEIAALRDEYEGGGDEDLTCPDCGAAFADNGAYLAHLASEHP
jgi:hypothetical protein